MIINPLDLNQEKRFLLNKMERTHENMFITGKAGTGKSYLLRCFLEHTKKNAVVVAPTGLSALNIGGSTIHRFFGLKPEVQVPEKIDNSVIYGNKHDTFKNLEVLIIDEISMVRSDLLDAVDYILKKANRSSLSFGGKQIIMFGDPYQLPPVIRTGSDEEAYIMDRYKGEYFFNAPAVKEGNFCIYELKEVFRQNDSDFKDALNHIREGEQSSIDLNLLNTRVSNNTKRSYKDDYITLTTTNDGAYKVNHEMLDQIESPEHRYYAWVEGEFPDANYPTEKNLVLKCGSHVMMLNNDIDRRWVNGSLAVVEECDSSSITVRIADTGKKCIVYKSKWEELDYYYDKEKKKIESKVIGTFNQLPVKLAWAITIHKSQGQTYENAEIDLGRGTFACGQAYVAVSRVKSLKGLSLKRPISKSDILVSDPVKHFMFDRNIDNIENQMSRYRSALA